jgi:murein DD-endopeptidase MepM/ murein hydrolase activator NlpD
MNRILRRLTRALAQRYQVMVINNKTYAQERHFNISYGRFLLIIITPILATIMLTAVVIAFTPIRELIPGYTDADLQRKANFLVEKVRELESEQAQKDSLIKSFQTVSNLTGGTDNRNVQTVAEPTPQPTPVQRNEPVAANTQNRTPNVPPVAPKINFKAPVDGYLTNTFNADANHLAVDLVAAQGSLIRATADGFVIMADYTTSTGHVIGLSHPQGYLSFYKHNRSIFKKIGQYVRSGEVIGVIGNSGENSTGPHLHFELWHQGQPVDPLSYIQFKKY